MFENAYFSEAWCVGVIVPLHKRGSIHTPSKYRSISLLSIMSKLYTSIFNNRLTYWCDVTCKIVESQAGFRREYSTIDNIFVLQSVIQRYLGKSKTKIYVFFVNFAKAFDSVKHMKLWSVLKQQGVSVKMIRLVQSIYKSVKACVKHNNAFSESFPCSVGVRQGSVLSPLLFSIFINELAVEIEQNSGPGIQLHPDIMQLFLVLFADDVILLSDSIIGLQRRIDALARFSVEYGLNVNLDKTKVVVFKRGGSLSRKERWFYNGKRLECVNSYNYLGITFTRTLAWSSHFTSASIQPKKALRAILHSLKHVKGVSSDVFFRIFDVKLAPILLYGAEVWGFIKMITIRS